MNLADYLSELLGQREEVSVPGLGYFVREHVNAYYSDSEARFYPPYHRVKFVPEFRDDDTFAQYVADKKNISLASSKYFAEKFIAKLQEDAAKGRYLFSDLGSFTLNEGQLVFKPNERIAADPAFYGFPTVNIYKSGEPVLGQVKPVFAGQGSYAPAAAQPVDTVDTQQYFEEETERKRGMNIWLILLIVLVAIALAVFGIYKFSPAAHAKIDAVVGKITGKQDTVSSVLRHEEKPAAKPDTAKVIAIKDTASQISAAPADTVKPSRWEVVEHSYKKLPWAQQAVRYLRSKGVDAKILIDVPGPLLKVSVGTYKTFKEADSARTELINAHKIRPTTANPIEIKLQQ